MYLWIALAVVSVQLLLGQLIVMVRRRAKTRARRVSSVAGAFVLAAGVSAWCGMSRYTEGPRHWLYGFPIPYVVFQLENGHWTDFVTPAPMVLAVIDGMIVLAIAFVPLFVDKVRQLGRQKRERGRSDQGLCAACAYDLTGNTSGICSECGLAVPVSQPQSNESAAQSG